VHLPPARRRIPALRPSRLHRRLLRSASSRRARSPPRHRPPPARSQRPPGPPR
jgi:hypothetical protein